MLSATSEPLSLGTAVLVAATHAGAPSHWAPFVLVGRTHRWTRRKLLAVTAAAAAGHAIVTCVLGGVLALIGHEMRARAEVFGERTAAVLLLGVGLFYVLTGLRGHRHHHATPVCESDGPGHSHPFIVLSLISMLSLSPCMAVAVVFLPAASLPSVLLLGLAYGAVTVVSMTLIVGVAAAGVERLKLHFLEHHGQLITGVLLALLGLGVALAGCSRAEKPPMPPSNARRLTDDEALLDRANSVSIDERIRLCERILREYGETASAFGAAHILAQDYLAKGRLDDARATYEKIVTKYRNPMALAGALDFLADYWERRNEHEKAAPYLEQRVDLYRRRLEEKPEGWTGPDGILLGDSLYGLSRLDEAAAAYRRIVKASFESQEVALIGIEAARRLAQTLQRQGKKPEAIEAVDQAEAILGKSGLGEADRGRFLESLRQLRDEIGK